MLVINHYLLTKFTSKYIISGLTFGAKAIEKFIREETEVRTTNKGVKMAEPLTNTILVSILHLIRRDLVRNMRAPPCWIPPRQVPARRRCRHLHRSGPRVVTPSPQYRPMEPSPPRVPKQTLPGPPLPLFGIPYTPRSQVDLGRLVRPLEGATPFTVAGLVRAPASEEGRRSPAVEPLTRGTTDLSITDQPATPYHRPNPPSPTPEEANPNPNRSGFGSSSRLSPLGNRVIC
jgi:hypothetical protein